MILMQKLFHTAFETSHEIHSDLSIFVLCFSLTLRKSLSRPLHVAQIPQTPMEQRITDLLQRHSEGSLMLSVLTASQSTERLF
jgi:hypothetical protein